MSPKRESAILLAARIALVLSILALAALPLFAHSWYDPACCGGQDCAPIPSITVTAGPDAEMLTPPLAPVRPAAGRRSCGGRGRSPEFGRVDSGFEDL